jgi:type 1 fimbria pilin
MKKVLLATLIALASNAALADGSIVMKVQGKMNNASCTPELSNGGSIDFGTISLDQLSPTQTNQMGHKDMSLTINCPSATKVAWSIADNKEDSNAANDLSSSEFAIHDATDTGGEVYGSGTTYGVGTTAAGDKIGAYAISTRVNDITANGIPAQAIFAPAYVNSKGEYMWRNLSTGVIANDNAEIMTATKPGYTAPLAITNVVFPFKVSLAIVNTNRLSTTDEAQLSGETTITLVYL